MLHKWNDQETTFFLWEDNFFFFLLCWDWRLSRFLKRLCFSFSEHKLNYFHLLEMECPRWLLIMVFVCRPGFGSLCCDFRDMDKILVSSALPFAITWQRTQQFIATLLFVYYYYCDISIYPSVHLSHLTYWSEPSHQRKKVDLDSVLNVTGIEPT